MKDKSQYYSFFIRLGILCFISVLIGAVFEKITLFLLITLMVVFIWYNLNLIRLNTWLWTNKTLYPPQSRGIWRGVFDGIYKIQKNNRARRKELGRMLKRFRDGAESIPDAVVVLGKYGEIAWSNKLAQHILGVRWPDDSGVKIDNLIRHPSFVRAYSEKHIEEPLFIPSPINDERIIEIRIVPYSFSERLLLARDVTQVHRINQMRKDFIANVSHELRTPLTVLQGYLEVMADPELAGSCKPKTIDTMNEQCERMMNLVNQLLSLSRIEANQSCVFELQVNVPAMLAVISSEIEQLNSDRQHVIVFDVDSELVVFAKDDELRSAFTNLIKNAVRYSPDRSEICISWKQTSHGATFSVKDNGDGIAPQHLARLTERFYRVDKARSRDTGGSGLGLSIVKHVLAHHNSSLEIDSELGKGSLFYFTLPLELIVTEEKKWH